MPLNGSKIHPPSAHALGELRRIVQATIPQQSVNAGVNSRLHDEQLVETIQLPSPYAIHKGKNIPHLKATEAGIARAAAGPQVVK